MSCHEGPSSATKGTRAWDRAGRPCQKEFDCTFFVATNSSWLCCVWSLHTAHLGPAGLCLKGHFVALIGSGAQQVGTELRKQGVTARTWTVVDLTTTPSALRTLARECKNGRLRAAFVSPHVSEESVALKVIRRHRLLKGPLLSGMWPFLMSPDRKLPRCDLAQRWKRTNSLRRTEASTEPQLILSSQVDPVDMHGTQFWCSFSSRRCLKKQPAQHSARVARSIGARSCRAFATRNDGVAHASQWCPYIAICPPRSHPANS